jgi:hypothetical protein
MFVVVVVVVVVVVLMNHNTRLATGLRRSGMLDFAFPCCVKNVPDKTQKGKDEEFQRTRNNMAS